MNKSVKTVPSKRLLFLDLMKIVSISYIFVFHFLIDYGSHNENFNIDAIINALGRPNLNFGFMANILFILVSGTSLSLSLSISQKNNNFELNYKSIFNFYKKRLIRILIPYYIVYFYVYIYFAINNKTFIFFRNLRFIDYLWNILALDGYVISFGIKSAYLNIGEWFLGCIIICYIFFPFLYYFNKNKKYFTFMIMTFYIIVVILVNKNLPLHLNALYHIYNFYLGIFLSDFKPIKKISIKHCILFVPLIIYLYLLKIKLPLNLLIQSYIGVLIYTIFYSLENHLKEKHITSLLTNFSTISYEFFLIHHVVITQTGILISTAKFNKVLGLHVFINDIMWAIILAIIFNKICTTFNNLCIKPLLKNKI